MPLPVGGEPDERDYVVGVDLGTEGELVVELALALERAGGVHDLDGDVSRRASQGGAVDGAEAALAEEEGGGEIGGGLAEGGVGEAVGREGGGGGGSRDGAFLLAEGGEAGGEEEEEREGEGEVREETGGLVGWLRWWLWRRRRWGERARGHGGRRCDASKV